MRRSGTQTRRAKRTPDPGHNNAQFRWPVRADVPTAPVLDIDPASTGLMWRLIDAIYAGPLEEKLWTRLTELLDAEFGCHAMAVLHWPEGRSGGTITSSDEALSRKLLRDPVVAAEFRDLPIGQICDHPGLVMIGIDFRTPDSRANIKLRLAKTDGSRFDARTLALLRQVAPHLARAAHTYSTIGMLHYMVNDYVETAFELSVAIVVLDPEFHVLHCMGATESLFAAGAFGIAGDNIFFCADPKANAMLRKAFVEVLSHSERDRHLTHHLLPIRDKEGSRTWHLSLKKMPFVKVAQQDFETSIKLFIRSTAVGTPITAGLLSDLFGLTPTEAKITTQLAQGSALYDIADRMGIMRNTARSHLSSVFLKMNVHRQTELVQKILSLNETHWL